MNGLTRWSLYLFYITVGGWIQPHLLGCAHTAHVVAACKAEVTDALVNRASAALAGADYEKQLQLLLGETVLCALRGAVQEAIQAAQSAKMSGTVDARVITLHGEAWLAGHPL